MWLVTLKLGLPAQLAQLVKRSAHILKVMCEPDWVGKISLRLFTYVIVLSLVQLSFTAEYEGVSRLQSKEASTGEPGNAG